MTEREEDKRGGVDLRIPDEALKNKTFKEEIDDRLLHTLKESRRAQEAIEEIIKRYIKRSWHVLLTGLIVTALALVGAITTVLKLISWQQGS